MCVCLYAIIQPLSIIFRYVGPSLGVSNESKKCHYQKEEKPPIHEGTMCLPSY